jgi:hypothetical protein
MNGNLDDVIVANNETAQRYEARVDGPLAVITYQRLHSVAGSLALGGEQAMLAGAIYSLPGRWPRPGRARLG